MASGKPVAGAAARAIPEYVREGVTGHLFDAKSSVAAAGAILKCLRAEDYEDACVRTAEAVSVVSCTSRLVDTYRVLKRDWESGRIAHGTGHIFG